MPPLGSFEENNNMNYTNTNNKNNNNSNHQNIDHNILYNWPNTNTNLNNDSYKNYSPEHTFTKKIVTLPPNEIKITIDPAKDTTDTTKDKIPNYDDTLFGIRIAPETSQLGSKIQKRKQLMRHILKRCHLIYGVPINITKEDIFKVYSKFGEIICITSENEINDIIGKPDKDLAVDLTRRYMNPYIKNPHNITTCFYVVYKTKKEFTNCAIAASKDPNLNVFKMDKKIKEWKL